MHHEYTAITRFADLDTQRHVTSRTYEQFALEGRYQVLAKLGYNQERIQNEQIYLEAMRGYSKFHRQQFPGVQLKVDTFAAAHGGEGVIHWDQKIKDQAGELVCHLQLETRTTRAGEPLALDGIEKAANFEILYDDLKPWSGNNERVVSYYTMPYSDRDFAGRYNVASLWRIFEEGRWMFAEKTGLTYDRIVEMDTTSFYMGSIANFFAEVPAGRTLQIMTWIERVDKIRYYFRQDVLLNGKLMLAMRDEQLIVSLSKARPQRASAMFMSFMGKFVEFPT
ncbi:MAG: acyl-[acyl-carrier-protein] thioesterase [Leptospiraceae bacterium]|nr:acyl-[acyl-carrier-protein] thioesterase [Leptospiraceae bacterium]